MTEYIPKVEARSVFRKGKIHILKIAFILHTIPVMKTPSFVNNAKDIKILYNN